MRVYTRRGDDGTTALRSGARVRKDSLAVEVNGTVDEAQAFLGLARAELARGEATDTLLVALERDLWVLMAEVATPSAARDGLVPGETAVSPEMVTRLEEAIDAALEGLDLAASFAVPGDNRVSATLDCARTVVRRAERLAVGLELAGSLVVTYLNRLSDLCWALARRAEREHLVNARARSARGRGGR